jgi:hypothetical protein
LPDVPIYVEIESTARDAIKMAAPILPVETRRIYAIATIRGNTGTTFGLLVGVGSEPQFSFQEASTRMLQRGGKTAFPRLYKRVRPSGNMARAAKIIVDPKTPVINCNVVDYSAGGACLEICGQSALPSRFELLYGTIRKKCRVVWTRGIRLGVTF